LVSGWHEEFVALCALSTSGELSEEEWQRLHEHLATCASCRAAKADYERLASHVMPVLAASAGAELEAGEESGGFSFDDAERRLMERLASESPRTADPPPGTAPGLRWRAPLVLLVAASILVAVLSFRRVGLQPRTQPAQVAPQTSVVDIKPGLPQQFDSATMLQRDLERAKGEVVSLRKQLNQRTAALEQARAAAEDLTQRLDAEQNQLHQVAGERETLDQKLITVQAEVQSLRDKTATSGDAEAQRATQMAGLEERVQNLNAALEEKDHALAQDQELLAHDRDIRDLIGARNLYMAEIYDVAQTGITKKPFGRVFYTKDKSLIFYGYDLDQQPGLKRSVTFQAWGKSSSEQNVNLGLFYQDTSNKRWILRFNDASTLARLNTIFVTAEPEGGSTKPTGKPLLMTYLRLEPNHP